jgi:hypothetical protein
VLMGAAATNYPFFLDKMALNDDTALLWTGSDWEPFQDAGREELKERQVARAKRYSIGIKAGGALSPPKGYPTAENEYGDPVNYRYPADAEHAQAAVSYFNQAKNKSAGGYSDTEWAIVGKRLAEMISHRLKASYQYKDGALVRKDSDMSDQENLINGGQNMPEENLNAPVEEPTEPTENATEAPAEDYAERFKALEEKFAEVQGLLEQEKKQREVVEERFAESEKARRMIHFVDTVRTFAVADELEKFAEDLYAIEQVDADLAERMIARLRANAEAANAGELFSQKSKATAPAHQDPFLAGVEKTRIERFSELPEAEGWVEAEKRFAAENPEMARDFANRTRGG